MLVQRFDWLKAIVTTLYSSIRSKTLLLSFSVSIVLKDAFQLF